MRVLVAVLLAALALWAGYWFVGQRQIETRLAAALAEGASGGLVLTQAGIEVAGFPSRFDLTITEPALSDPARGWGASAEFAQVLAMTWKPWHLIGVLPGTVSLHTPGGPLALNSTRFRASLTYAPSADLPLEAAIVEVDAPALLGQDGAIVAAERLVLALRREARAEPAYRLGLQIAALAGRAQAAPADARLDAVIVTTAPLDRRALAAPPEIAAIELTALSIDWGAIRLTGEGRIAPSALGLAEGEVALRLTGWRDLPSALSAAGLLPTGPAEALRRAREAVAQDQGNPEALTLPLRFQGGLTLLGGQVLGPAPGMAQRQ
ncbi:MAG: DUF2125 domain-containing protein [Paracoccaceae bacterium]